MRILKKRNILKLAATFMLVGMMAGAFAMQAKAAVAATTLTCADGTIIASGGTCDTGVGTGAFDANLAYHSDLPPNITTVIVGTNTFTFHTTVVDTRGTATGWSLRALSAGLTSDFGGAPPVNMNIKTSTCSGCTAPSTGTFTALIPITTTAATFISDAETGLGTASETGVVTTSGDFSIVAADKGTYAGSITLSLVTGVV